MSRPFVTTVIGSLPKPAWLYERAPLGAAATDHHGRGAAWALEGEALREAQDDAVRVAVHDQERAGIDIISDGEQRRKSYLTYVTMRLDGFDYQHLAAKAIRGGRRVAQVGRCVGPVRRRGPIVVDDLRFLMSETRSAVKVTLPGPMTVADSIADEHYHDERALAMAALRAQLEERDGQMPAALTPLSEPKSRRWWAFWRRSNRG